MSVAQILLAGYPYPLRVVDSADFDGTNDWMTRTAGLTGAADSKTGILSVWVRNDVAQDNSILESTNTRTKVAWLHATSKFEVYCRNSVGAQLFVLRSNLSTYGTATWYHLLASWTLATTTTHLWINNVDDKVDFISAVNDTIDYTLADWAVGAEIAGTLKYSGCIADLYFAPGQYLDFSNVYNRRKFISASGKPVYLGADGSVPTGTAPLMYHRLDDAEAVANFATNRGAGGNFTITGTLTTSSTSPSD